MKKQQPQDRVVLKNIQLNLRNSDETFCFAASVYIDGKRAGEVRNSGRGGPNEYTPESVCKRLNEIAATMPPVIMEDIPSGVMAINDEIIIGELMNSYLRNKEHTRLCKGKTVYRIPGEHYPPMSFHVWERPFTPDAKAALEKKYPGVFILNENIGADID